MNSHTEITNFNKKSSNTVSEELKLLPKNAEKKWKGNLWYKEEKPAKHPFDSSSNHKWTHRNKKEQAKHILSHEHYPSL